MDRNVEKYLKNIYFKLKTRDFKRKIHSFFKKMAYLPIKKSRYRPFFRHFYAQTPSSLALKKPINEKNDTLSVVQNTPLSSQVNVEPVVSRYNV